MRGEADRYVRGAHSLPHDLVMWENTAAGRLQVSCVRPFQQ